MAVVNVLSAQLTNRDATPIVLQDARLAGSELRGASGLVTVTNGDDIGSVYRFFSIPKKAKIRSLTISNVDVGGAADIGLYRTTKNGSAVVTAAFFTAAQTTDQVNAKVQVVNGNVITLANMEKSIGEQTGPVTVGDNEYDVCLTLTTAADITGAVFLEATFTEG